MSLQAVPVGRNVPDDINVIIEIPMHSPAVKYEVDKESGALFLDRMLKTAMHYPCNYGYIPHTLCGDGDPTDVMACTGKSNPWTTSTNCCGCRYLTSSTTTKTSKPASG
jgi:inorganic pyrophosphatase